MEESNHLLADVTELQVQKEATLKAIDDVINTKVLRDKSPEAKRGRRNRMLRAAYGEFACTIIFFTVLFSVIANGTINNWTTYEMTYLKALVSGLMATAVIYAFSSVSGAHFNCNISFALWLTNRLSNRRFVFYVCVQLLGSIVAMALVAATFHGDMKEIYDACSVIPSDENSPYVPKIFATEFLTTFILTYVAFTVAFEDAEHEKKSAMNFKGISDSKGLTVYASTPQSKTGFAPFAIGFTVFGLGLVGGTSGGAFNQVRMFGPAVFSGKWKYFYVYWIAQLCGAGIAALIVSNLYRFGLEHTSKNDTVSPASIVNKIPAGGTAAGSAAVLSRQSSYDYAGSVQSGAAGGGVGMGGPTVPLMSHTQLTHVNPMLSAHPYQEGGAGMSRS